MILNIFEHPQYASFIQNKVLTNVFGLKRHPNKWQFRCPICGDGKKSKSKRGWFDLTKNYYRCYNGGCLAELGMSGLKFVSLIENKSIAIIKREFLEYIRKFSKESTNLIEDINVKEQNTVQPIKTIYYEIQNDWQELTPLAKDYLNKRKIDFNINKFYSSKDNLRLIIPWYLNQSSFYLDIF